MTLGGFLALDLLLVATPGADWAFVVAVAAGLPARSARPAVLGLAAGYVLHATVVTAGLGALLADDPRAMGALTLGGAGYLLWLGVTTLRRPPAIVADGVAGTARPTRSEGTGEGHPRRRRTFLRGAAVSGLNPKGMLLFLAVLPQFVRPDAPWPVPVQTAVLGGLHVVTCTVVYSAVALAGRALLRTRPRAARAVTRVSGAAMALTGAALVAGHAL